MATTNTTHVNFVKVASMSSFNDIITKVDGTIYFIVDAKKIYLDGVMYGFNENDIDLTPFLKLTGGTMQGVINMNEYDLQKVGNLSFLNSANTISPQDASGGMEFRTGATGSGELILRLGIDNTITFNATSITGIPEPLGNSSPISKGYLETNVINKKGAVNGFAGLDSTGKVPSTQLPSYVDDVLEYAKKADFPATGESGILYIDLSNNYVWRWGGSAYVNVSDGNAHLTLGITASTAYQGDLGKIAYDHSQITGNNANPHGVNKVDVGLSDVRNYDVASQGDAEAGESNALYMTPIRTRQAITAIAPRLTWTVVS